ncbi:MAG TPA: type VI secretion system baseplate subunit TssK, partial [Rhodocyclaceae bacterium]|nr:type VI secretion system baseplate subunit TssK [Rhodocyclaceae bacterium]
MTTTLPLPDGVQWAEGMLLTPQHFQQHDIHWSAVLTHRLRGICSHHWGVVDLRIDAALLATSTVNVVQLACIFPDGTPFVLGADNPEPLTLAIAPADISAGKGLHVCIAMPPRTGAMNVQSTSIRRFETIPGTAPVIDEMTGFANVYVDRIRPSVKLYLAQNVPAGYQAVPLLELVHSVQSGKLEPTRFQPPALRMGATASMPGNASLMQALHSLRDQMWDKLHKLTGTAQNDGPEDEIGMSPEERMQLALARHIASALTMFDAVMLDPETSPAHAYRALAHVVGNMAWVGSNPSPLPMRAYAHEDCAPQFHEGIDYVTRKLALINTVWEGLAFSRVGDHSFLRRLPDSVSSPLFIEIRLREGQNLHDVRAWLSDARIASDDLMPLLKRRRLPGALWRLLDRQEIIALGLRSDAVVVRLDNQQLEVPQQGVVDCFRAGRGLLIQSDSPHLLPAAVILQHATAPAA